MMMIHAVITLNLNNSHSSDYAIMSNITEATPEDWEDFWYPPEKFGTWYPEDFYNSESEGREFKCNDQ